MSRFSETHKTEILSLDVSPGRDICFRVWTAQDDDLDADGRLIITTRSGGINNETQVNLTGIEMRSLADILQRAASRFDTLQNSERARA